MSSQSRSQPVANRSLFPASFSNPGLRPTAPFNSAYTQASNNPATARGMQGTMFRQFARPARRPEVPPPVLNTGNRGLFVERQALVPSPAQSRSASSISSITQLSPTSSPHALRASHLTAASDRSNHPSVPQSTQPVSPATPCTFDLAQQMDLVSTHAYMRSELPDSSTGPIPSPVSQAARAGNTIHASVPAHDTIDLTLSPSPSPKLGLAHLSPANSSALRGVTAIMVKTEPTTTFLPNAPSFPSTPAPCKNEPLDTVMEDPVTTPVAPEPPSMATLIPTSASITTPKQSTATALMPVTPASLSAPAAPTADSPAAPTADSSAAPIRPAKRGRPSTKTGALTAPTPAPVKAKPVSTAKRPQLVQADVAGSVLIYADVVKRRKHRAAVDRELIDTKVHAATLSGRLEVLEREKLPGGSQDAVVAALTAALAESHRQIAQLHGSLDECESLLSVYRNACFQYGIVVDEYNTDGTGNYAGLASGQLPMVATDPMSMMPTNAMDLSADLDLPASASSGLEYVWDEEACGLPCG